MSEIRQEVVSALNDIFARRKGGEIVYTMENVDVGKDSIGGRMKVPILVVQGNRSFAIDAREQNVSGTTCEKLPFILDNLASLPIPAALVWRGEQWRKWENVLECHPLACHFNLQHQLMRRMALHFGWWDVLK